MTRTPCARRLAVALAIPALLVLAACSDDGGETTVEDTVAPEDTEGGADTTTAGPDTTGAAADTTAGADTTAAGADTTAGGNATEGFEFTSPEGDYTVVFPSEPTTSEQQAPTADGRMLPVTQHIAADGDTSFATAELAIPEGEPYDIEAGRDGSVSAVGGELIASEDVEVSGREGVEFVASVESGSIQGTYVSRILTDGETVYQLIVVGPGELSAGDEDIAAFFDSFAFTS